MVVLLIIAILLAIAIPTFLGVTSSANDRAAQSNLTDGLTEATAQYQSAGQTFTGVSASLSASAPEYAWTSSSGTCSTSQTTCISVFPVDVSVAGDQQGVILAAMSKTGTCWWIAQLQASPSATALASPGFIQSTTVGHAGAQENASGTAVLTSAGTFYGKKAGTTSANCYASYPESAAGFKWGTSFSNAGGN
jgi:type IV pilus assembly protein PilA